MPPSRSKPSALPYGSWPSPLTAESLVTGAAGIYEVVFDVARPSMLWWGETRPTEGGRTAVMCRDLRADDAREVTPPEANARSRVHEYGGGAWWPHDGSLLYVEYTDQRIWRIDETDGEPYPLVPEPPTPGAWRYNDLRTTPDGRWCICLRERHDTEGEPANELVAMATDGLGDVSLLWSGSDFVMSPRVSPDGSMLAWISWDHSNMPWDSTRLHVCHFADGQLGEQVLTIGSDDDSSLCEPDWVRGRVGGVADRSPENPGAEPTLLVCSDHDGWWGLYEVDLNSGELVPTVCGDFEVATPPWVAGMQRWVAVGDNLAAAVTRPAGDELWLNGTEVALSDTSISSLTLGVAPDGDPVLAYAGAGFGHETEVVAMHVQVPEKQPVRNVVRPGRDLGVDPSLFGVPEAITFPTGEGNTTKAHALYYAPTNPGFEGQADELPPLMVVAHGGPTAAAARQLQLGITYWTTRGIAVVDVDYRGSTGYGRDYRRALDGCWGVADVDDCVAAARYLVERGDVDPSRLLIRGGSAGGFTVLAALAFHNTFAAGASRYGIADLEALALHTHKFESRYLDRLVGPYPEAKDLYRQRSPIHNLDGFNAPMIVLQGDEDAIVPPEQSEMIVEALSQRNVPVTYVLFEGEQHGFRKAENIVRALETELAFFGEVCGFVPADDLS